MTRAMTDYSDTYDPDLDFDRHYTLATARRIARRVSSGQRLLELGCATGLMSSVLAPALGPSGELVGVDRSPAYLERAHARGLDNARFVLGDLERLPDVGSGYAHVVATNVLHELADPEAFLRAAAGLLGEDGTMHVTLQNPASIHRLCAVDLGLLDSASEISDRGRQWGTLGLWTADELVELAERAGLRVVERAGVMLKPLPNALMAALPDEVVEGFIRVADRFPEHCAMTYLVLAAG